MQRNEQGISEVVSRVAENLGRLVGQHLRLLRLEVEAEGRAALEQARRQGVALAALAPFVIAGVVLVSLAVAFGLAVPLRGVLGEAATPVALALVGLAEATAAFVGIRRVLGRAPAKPPGTVDDQPEARADERRTPAHSQAERPRLEEKDYGAVGRA